MFSRHERHRLTDVSDELRCEDWLVAEFNAEGLSAGNVMGDEHRAHARANHRRRNINRENPGMGMWATHRTSPKHAIRR
jgi:hypothetical protein